VSTPAWSELEALFHEGLALVPAERAVWLAKCCAGRPDLRAQIEAMLRAHDEAHSTLNVAATTAHTALPPGARLGAYEIVGPLGTGGMGEVYRARDMRLGREVALKVLPELFALDADRLARFRREAHVLAALNHPNIAAIHSLEESDGEQALVLELVDGPTLAELVARGPMPTAEALNVARQIAGALDAAHAKGIVHRDLKPANIALTRDGVVKVLDFGLAKLRGKGGAGGADGLPTMTIEDTREGVIVGTAAYMSPEQVRGQAVDERTDIWAFGCVLYEMLAGQPAFGGETASDIVAAILERQARWDGVPGSTPAVIRTLLRRCLEKDRTRRPDSAAVVRLELERALEPRAEGTFGEPARDRGDLRPSIAVLPFANLSPEKENEYFSDALTEEVINLLARIPGLKVTARTSAFAFRGKEQDIRKIADSLDVRTVLEGSVRRAGNRIRVTAQLINAADGYHLWSERYDRDLTDVFAIQDEIAQGIGAALQMKLTAQGAGLRRYTPGLPAYEAFLKAQYLRARLTPESLARSLEYYAEAAALDARYAAPRAGRGYTLVLQAYFGMQPAHATIPLARAAEQQAVELDPLLPEAQAVLGAVAALYDYDWQEAERRSGQATVQQPVSSETRALYASYYLLPRGCYREAAEELELALREDPLNLLLRAHLAWGLWSSGRDADALAELRRVLELDQRYWLAHIFVSFIQGWRGMLADALPSAEKACELAPWDIVPAGNLAGLLVRAGDGDRARVLLERLGEGPAYHAPLAHFVYSLAARDMDAAADWAEKTIQQRAPALMNFLFCPLADALRSGPHWPRLAGLLNLPAAR